jgi:hypothetical protein
MTPFETAAGRPGGRERKRLGDGMAFAAKEANPALGRGAEGRIVNYFQNEYRALAHFPPRF